MTILSELENLREKISKLVEGDIFPDSIERLDYRIQNNGVHIFFFGANWGEAYCMLLEALMREEISKALVSLMIDGPDEGANGTRNWDISSLANSPVLFPELEHLSLSQGKVDDHNQTIIASIFEEGGDIGKLVRKSPKLRTLVVPSAPAANFFNRPLKNLRYTDVNAGYDTQDFVDNLTAAGAEFAPNLTSLTWGDYSETYIENWIEQTTPFASMERLFKSSVFDSLRVFVLKNPTYSDEQLQQLAALRPKLQFKIIRTSSHYCRSSNC